MQLENDQPHCHTATQPHLRSKQFMVSTPMQLQTAVFQDHHSPTAIVSLNIYFPAFSMSGTCVVGSCIPYWYGTVHDPNS